jgi:hypothetical protein
VDFAIVRAILFCVETYVLPRRRVAFFLGTREPSEAFRQQAPNVVEASLAVLVEMGYSSSHVLYFGGDDELAQPVCAARDAVRDHGIGLIG